MSTIQHTNTGGGAAALTPTKRKEIESASSGTKTRKKSAAGRDRDSSDVQIIGKPQSMPIAIPRSQPLPPPSARPVIPASAAHTSSASAPGRLPLASVPTATSSSAAVPEEKRLKRYRSHMTMEVRKRIQRALSQKLFLLEQLPDSAADGLTRQFRVLGLTGNVYTVTVGHLSTCTCPDAAKHGQCKHLFFVLHRVLKVAMSSPLMWQSALLTNELRSIFANAPNPSRDVIAEKRVLKEYKRAAGENVSDDGEDGGGVVQKPLQSDTECAICFEVMIPANSIVWCRAVCGNSVHSQCFDMWARAKKSGGQAVTCPYCRAPWAEATTVNRTGSSSGGSGEYLNLAHASNIITPAAIEDAYRHGGYYDGTKRYRRRSWRDDDDHDDDDDDYGYDDDSYY